MKRALLRAATVLAAALAIGAMTASSATASPLIQEFSVPSGDNCTYGLTEGQLQWSSYPARTVLVTGTVVDRPTQNDTVACRDDGRYTIAKFTAYGANRVIDEVAQRVNNGTRRVRFALDAGANTVGIDLVTIQVCRVVLPTAPTPGPIPPDYCGRTHFFRPTAITPQSAV